MVVLISEKIELQKNTTASSTGDICGNKMVNFTVKHNNARASMYMRQKLKALKGEKYFNIPASEIKGKGRKCMQEAENVWNMIDPWVQTAAFQEHKIHAPRCSERIS